jgi:uncharacterized protein (TIGR00251 family)
LHKNLTAVEETDGGSYLRLKVETNRNESKIGNMDIWRNAITVSVTSAPISGRANMELVRVLERMFPEAKGRIVIVKGQKSGLKKVFLPVSPEVIADRLGLNQ